jgi:hypothetical protein
LSSAPSYKSLIDQLTAFADGHFIIRKFTFGEETDYDLEKEGEYPAMHVLHPTVSVEKGAINYDLVIQFADLPRDIETKTTYQMEQISDLFRLGQDLLNTITNENDVMLFGEDAEIIGTPRMEAFAQETKNNLVVVSLSFTLQLPNDWSACDIPADWTIGQSGGDTPGVPVVYVISVTGLDTDNTDPQNPIVRIAVDGVTITGDGTPGDPLVAAGGSGTVTSVDVTADGDAITTDGGPITTSGTINIEFNGASTDYIDGEGNLQTFPTIPPDPTNVYVPLAGTDNGYPVTGDIEFDNDVKLIRNGGVGITSRMLLNNSFANLQYTDGTITSNVNADSVNANLNYSDATGAAYIQVYPQYVEIGSGANFIGAVYDADNSANFTLRSLVDAGFVKGFIYHASGAPTIDDDSDEEFEVGTLWIDYSVSPPELYVCEDASVGAAVWTQVGAAGGGVASVSGNIVDNTDPANPVVTQVQANWNESDNTDPSFIQNKPTIPSGTVTSVGLSAPTEFTVTNSPVTGSGTLTLTKANQNANLVYAGPTTGSAAAPTFRSLVLADIPSGVAKETWANGQGSTTVAAGATEYGSLYGGSVGDSTTESARQSVVPSAGTISRWYFRTSSGQPASGALTLRTRINGVNGNLLITIAAGSASGTFSDLVNSDTVAAGDLVNYSIANASAGASAQQLTTSNLFTFS